MSLQRKGNRVMQTTYLGSSRTSRTWNIAAYFSPSAHGLLYDSNLQYSLEYIRDILTSRLQHMQKHENNMYSITLLSFAYPRVRSSPEVPVPVEVTVLLHFSNLIGFSTIHALLGRGTIGITVTCTPVDFEKGKPCPDVTLHPIFATFLRKSSKDMGPAVDPNLYVRVDVVGDSDAKQATISAMETRSRAWTFKATFAPPLHPALVSNCNKVAADYIQDMLNMRVVDGLVYFSFALPSERSELGSHGAVFVTGMLNGQDSLRLRTVRSIFPPDLPVIWTPIQSGRGISFTSSSLYTEYVKKCSNESSDSTNPDSLIRVDVRGVIDDVRPKKTGPKGPRKPLQLLDANMENIMNELQAPCSGGESCRGVFFPPSCARDENAAPLPTPPSVAPRLASEPSVIPRSTLSSPHYIHRRPILPQTPCGLAPTDPARVARRPGDSRGPAAPHIRFGFWRPRGSIHCASRAGDAGVPPASGGG